MIIDDTLFPTLRTFIVAGMINLENNRLYYDAINDSSLRKFLTDNKCATPHFKFLCEVLDDQEVTRCPKCGHYNSNIECPIIRCSYCDFEFKITTPSSEEVCHECVAYKTDHCNKEPQEKGDDSDGNAKT